MSITAYRYRAADGLVVLQVQEYTQDRYSYSTSTWRDAKVEDLLEVARLQIVVTDPRQDPSKWPLDPA